MNDDNTLKIVFLPNFQDVLKKLKEPTKSEVKKKIEKIVKNPKIGKPMRYGRKGTREVYVGSKSFRLSYKYLEDENTIYFADFYHKKHQ